MINRHHLRVKLLQWLFASRQQNQEDYREVAKQFKASASTSMRSYVMAFRLLDALIFYAEIRLEERQGRHLQENRDPGPAHALAGNPLAPLLEKDPSYAVALKSTGIENMEISTDMLRAMFESVSEGTCTASKNLSLDTLDGLKVFFDKCICSGDWYPSWQQEHNLYWDSDRYLIDRQVLQTLDSMKAGSPFPDTKAMLQTWQSEDTMIQTLLESLLGNPSVHLERIEKHAGQWDPDRLARMDLLLLQMACTEWLLLPDVPVKVTMNEYIELAKTFSTPQSSSFINGLLDKIKADLLREGLIQKTGRGLVES